MEEVKTTYKDFLQPRDAWDALSMREKAEMIGVAVRNGITNLQDIRERYNEFAEGGPVDTDWSYNSWKKQIAEHMGIRPDEDNTYDYEAYFKKYPEEAWKMLKGDPDAHFSDEFKTVYHPTFSSKSIGNDGSIYSGVRNSKTNPQGLVGGTWSPDYHTFTMSYDGYRGPVSMDDRKWYLENAENNGVQLREADGSLPIYDGIPWGGVLPNVTIYSSKHSLGGPLVESAMNEYKKGGSIHIAPSKKGTFTAAAKKHGKSVQAFASQVLAHPENYSPAMRKKANFARNAAKWHGLGGNLLLTGGLTQDNDPATKDWERRREHEEVHPMYQRTQKDEEYWREKQARNAQAVEELNRKKGVVMSALEEQANSAPFTGEGYKQAVDGQRQRALDKAKDFEKGARAVVTAAELGLSGASLLGAYANWKNWANAASLTKRGIANLLQKAQAPMQEAGALIDGYQTMDALGNNEFDTYYNGASGVLGVAGTIGASDIFRGRYPMVDRFLDTSGIIQNAGDFIKFGYDTFSRNNNNEKALGGNLFDGTSQPTQKMQIGLDVQGWPNYTTEQIIANGERVQQQRKTPEENVFSNFVVKAYEDPMVIMAKESPEYRKSLSKMYDDENFRYNDPRLQTKEAFTKERAKRLLEIYKQAGEPKFKPLPSNEPRAYTKDIPFFKSSRHFNRATMYLNEEPVEGFSDIVAELSHPIQKRFGNNKPWKERLNPFYDVDNYNGKTRYDFANTYEYETHEDFEPIFWDYITDGALLGQKFHTGKIEGEQKLGNDNIIYNPSFQQLVDSARVYNRRKQNAHYEHKNPLSDY